MGAKQALIHGGSTDEACHSEWSHMTAWVLLLLLMRRLQGPVTCMLVLPAKTL